MKVIQRINWSISIGLEKIQGEVSQRLPFAGVEQWQTMSYPCSHEPTGVSSHSFCSIVKLVILLTSLFWRPREPTLYFPHFVWLHLVLIFLEVFFWNVTDSFEHMPGGKVGFVGFPLPMVADAGAIFQVSDHSPFPDILLPFFLLKRPSVCGTQGHYWLETHSGLG